MSLTKLIRFAIEEDLPNGDTTTDSLAKPPQIGQAKLIAKEDMVLSGKAPFEESVRFLEVSAKIRWYFEEGELILRGQTICNIQGDLLEILKAERTALNFLGHLSGIATLTRCFVEKVKGTQTKILDTRKTTPGFRDLEKKAVRHGGGVNHRQNLTDAILIKENHIHLMDGVENALQKVKENSNLPICIEVKNMEDIKRALPLKPQRMLLDNMDNAQLTEAIKVIPKSIETEASGNMTLDRVESVAQLGVNFISVGALTHSAPRADVSLLFDWQNSQ